MSLPRHLIVAGALAVLIGSMVLIVFADDGLMELNRLRETERQVEQHNETLTQENIDLYRTILRLKRDPTYIENVARNELGMIGRDDVIIMIPGAAKQGQ